MSLKRQRDAPIDLAQSKKSRVSLPPRSSCDRLVSQNMTSDNLFLHPPEVWKEAGSSSKDIPAYATGRLLPLDKHSPAALMIANYFHATMGHWAEIVKSEAIENLARWTAYLTRRQEHQRVLGERFVEKYAFHGTSLTSINAIINQGFDRARQKISAYGKGTYFALRACYSADPQFAKPDASGLQRLILARVLVGEYCEGQRDALPSDKPGQEHVPHESTVDKINNPTILATYKDDQAFAEFVITFRWRHPPLQHPSLLIPPQPSAVADVQNPPPVQDLLSVSLLTPQPDAAAAVKHPPQLQPLLIPQPAATAGVQNLVNDKEKMRLVVELLTKLYGTSVASNKKEDPPVEEKIYLVVQMEDTIYGIMFLQDKPLFYLAKGVSKRRSARTLNATGMQLLMGQTPQDLSKTPRQLQLQKNDFLKVQFV